MTPEPRLCWVYCRGTPKKCRKNWELGSFSSRGTKSLTMFLSVLMLTTEGRMTLAGAEKEGGPCWVETMAASGLADQTAAGAVRVRTMSNILFTGSLQGSIFGL